MQVINPSAKACMRRLKTKNMEISQCLDSISIKAFRKGIKRDMGLFIDLTKITQHSLNAVYKEA